MQFIWMGLLAQCFLNKGPFSAKDRACLYTRKYEKSVITGKHGTLRHQYLQNNIPETGKVTIAVRILCIVSKIEKFDEIHKINCSDNF